MGSLFSEVDRLLRGSHTQPADLAAGRLGVHAPFLVRAAAILGASYGLFMGLYAAMRGGTGGTLQILATTFKVPLLFLLTLGVTFPSLYVFSALAQSRLSFRETLRLLLAAITINLALLSSFGPITGFFTVSTASYPFMVILNVVFFAAAGAAGLSFLSRALNGMFAAPMDAASAVPQQQQARMVFKVWIVIFAIVGAQMSWVLRPFIGSPHRPFQLFRARESNFFVAVFEALRNLLS
jgi:hypothetical protein